VKESVAAKLASLVSRAKELDALLSDPDVTSNLDNFRKLSREHAEISPVVARYGEYAATEADIAAAEDMAKDPEMREFAESEIRAGRARLEEIGAEIQKMLLPKDPND
jgi:peptide chain release factor 1